MGRTKQKRGLDRQAKVWLHRAIHPMDFILSSMGHHGRLLSGSDML